MLLQTLLGKTLTFWKCTLSFLYLFFFWHNSTTFSLILLCTHCMLTFFFQSCHCCPSHVHDKWQAAVQPSLCCLVLLSGKFQSKSCVKRALQDVRRSNYYNEILKKKLVEGRMNERKNTYSYWYRTDVVLRKATVLLRGQI